MAKYLIEIPEGREYFPEFVPMDNFYSGIYMNPEHINAWRSEFYTDTLVGTSLIEEMSELTKAICKERRAKSYDPEIKASIREEIAHVLISLKGYCLAHGITSESIEEEIQKKWPAAYEKEENDEYYVVEKSELDAYMARKESLEHMNCTPVWDAYNRLKAKVNELESENAELRDSNKALGEENSKLTERNTKLKLRLDKFYGMTSAEEELRAANEKLKGEVADLNERINHLGVVLEFLDNKQAGLIIGNNKLRGTNRELNAVITNLRDKLALLGGE